MFTIANIKMCVRQILYQSNFLTAHKVSGKSQMEENSLAAATEQKMFQNI